MIEQRESLVGQVRAWSEMRGDELAVVDSTGSLTYAQLESDTNVLARLVSARKGTGDSFVIVMMPRTRQFITATFGVIKAGAANVIVNPAYPADRINAILRETKPIACITTSEVWAQKGGALELDETKVLKIDTLDFASGDRSHFDESRAEGKAMVLYTSGTTGKPKGVVHTLASVIATGRGIAHPQPTPPGVRYALVTDFGFIASVFVIYESLLTGGELHVIDEERRLNMDSLAEYIREHRLARTFMGSSMGVTMLKNYALGMEEVWLGGEKIVGLTAEAAAQTRVVNVYGMSELAPICLNEVKGDEQVVPAGRPYCGEMWVLDDAGQPVAAGVTGEVYCRAPRCASEYLAMPEQSAARFVECPWDAGAKMLRTGDRGYIDEQGLLVLCGRTDDMVKIRGLRVETGEIEVTAQGFCGVVACACVARKIRGEDQLCLYYEGAESVDRSALKAHLANKLAEYMVPNVYVRLDQLPRNARGKIDRHALPEPMERLATEKVPPASDNEAALLGIAARLLKCDDFGVTDDLFAMGMSSLMAMEMTVAAAKEGIRLKVSDVMRDKTIRAIIQRRTSIVWWYAPYDPTKDVAVFVHGIALTKNIAQKLAMWNERYNVMVIEPIQEHYRYLFTEDGLDEVAAFYYALMDWYMPTDARVRVMTGVSFGGKIAYLLACRWCDDTAQRPTVVMGDSLLTHNPELEDAIVAGTVGEWEEKHKVKLGESFIHRLGIIVSVERRGVTIPKYDGPVILLHAIKSVFMGDNSVEWAKYASNLRVIPMEAMHDVICLDREATMPTWRAVFEELK